MFSQLKNIDSAFKHIRLFSMLLVAGCVIITCYVIYKSFQQVSLSEQRIYVLANGKILEASGTDRQNDVEVEIRDEVRMFHHYFFTLDPDDEVIRKNIIRALYLADASAARQYDNLKEDGYYASVISNNISQRINMDSITINIDQTPYYFRYYGTLQITRPTSRITRSLVTEGYLRAVSRSDHDPHGFLIEKWRILQNKNLSNERVNNSNNSPY
jgi:conjugative transposon TraK protein